jgi:N4-gp56 family major capsid protein
MATFGTQGQDKLVAYANTNGVSNAAYNAQKDVTIKPDAYYDMMLLKMLRQMEFHYAKYAIQKTLPKNYGDTINWRRFKRLEVAANLGLLVEGQTPTGKTGISGEAITAVIQQYGEVMYFTDLVDLQQLDDVRREYTIELGYIAQETLDLIVRNSLVAEGSVFYSTGTSVAQVSESTAAAARPKIDDFRKIILGFKKDFVTGVRGANGRYIALISPEVMYALFDDQRMLQYMQFGQTNAPLMDGVAIDMFGIRFEEVLNAPVIGGAHDSIVLADEAYAITKLEGMGNVRVITKGLGSAGVEDPLDQRQSIGYKITGFASRVLRPESVVNYWSNPTIAGSQIVAGTFTPEGAGRADVNPVPAGTVPQLQAKFIPGAGITYGGTADDLIVQRAFGSTFAQVEALIPVEATGTPASYTVLGQSILVADIGNWIINKTLKDARVVLADKQIFVPEGFTLEITVVD